MAKSKTIRQPDSPLVEALLVAIEPFLALANEDPLRVSTASTDTGHEAPALRDKTFAFLLSTFANNCHTQLYGTPSAADGRTFDNAKTWHQKAKDREKDVIKNIWDTDKSDIENKLNVVSNSDWLRANHYVRMNEAKCQTLEELITSCAIVYKVLTKEDWKPRIQAQQPVTKITATDEEQARLVQLLDKTMGKQATA